MLKMFFDELPQLDAKSSHLLMFAMAKATFLCLNHRDEDVISCGRLPC